MAAHVAKPGEVSIREGFAPEPSGRHRIMEPLVLRATPEPFGIPVTPEDARVLRNEGR